jgi:hypothetical protein
MRQSIRRAKQPLWQVAAQKRPRFRLRREAPRRGGDMEQDRFNPFHHREPGESRCAGAWRTQQLSGGTYERGIVGMLAQTQCHGEFFIAQVRMIRREVAGKIALIVAGTTSDGTFEQPFADTLFRTSTQLADPSQQRRHMNRIAKASGQWRAVQLFNRFHDKTITQRAQGWRIPFREKVNTSEDFQVYDCGRIGQARIIYLCMSEYQYYEFQTVDDRLSEKEMQELRSYSTRAHITPTSFTNQYDWGNFKGDADAWMEKYFDGFLYLANWGTREVQLAVPAKLLPADTAQRYCFSNAASSRERSGKLILTFLTDEEAHEEWIEGEGNLSSLLQIRNELAQGDLRSLYLGWLMGVQAGELTEEEEEPPVPPNFDALSGPQANLADFFRLDPDLLTVAAQNCPHTREEVAKHQELSSWVAALPSHEKDNIILRLMTGEETKVGMELQSRFRRQHDTNDSPAGEKRRTVAELLASAEARRCERQQEQARKSRSKNLLKNKSK